MISHRNFEHNLTQLFAVRLQAYLSFFEFLKVE